MAWIICFILGHRYDRPEYVAGYNARRCRNRDPRHGMYRARWCVRCQRVIDFGDLPERKS
jgi:hypothetical protein